MSDNGPTNATDIVIELPNEPGQLAKVATAISDAGVNLAAATCLGEGSTAELHILVPHSEPVRHALAITNTAISRERPVIVMQAKDRPGELATIASRASAAGVNVDLIYVATNSRVVLGADDLDGLREALDGLNL